MIKSFQLTYRDCLPFVFFFSLLNDFIFHETDQKQNCWRFFVTCLHLTFKQNTNCDCEGMMRYSRLTRLFIAAMQKGYTWVDGSVICVFLLWGLFSPLIDSRPYKIKTCRIMIFFLSTASMEADKKAIGARNLKRTVDMVTNDTSHHIECYHHFKLNI